MNEAHWHLVLNHLPIIIPIMGFIIMMCGILLKSEILKRASYCVFIAGSLTAIVALSTGEGAEEIVEKINGIDEHLIKVHEEAAEIFAILIYVLGGISLVGLWANWKKKSFSNIISFVTIAFTLVVLFFAKQTGTSGGEIRHTEIRTNELNVQNTNNQDSEKRGADDD